MASKRIYNLTGQTTFDGSEKMPIDKSGNSEAKGAKLSDLKAFVNANGIGNLTDGSTVTWDFSLYNVAKWTIGGNRTLNITNVPANSTGVLYLKQDGTAGRVPALPGSTPTGMQFSIGANQTDVLAFTYDGTTFFWSIENYGTVSTTPTLNTPTSFAASVTDATHFALSWNSVLNATGYVLQRADDASFTVNLSTVYTGSGTSFNDTVTATTNTYYYRVKAQAASYLDSGYASVIAGSDTDASAFRVATGITDTTINAAVDTLVKSMKTAGLWTRMKAIYPFVGGTASTHKYNLKNPADTDAAFRIVFHGTMTHDANGITPGGTNADYGQLFITPSTDLDVTSASLGYYSRIHFTGLSNLISSYTSTSNVFQITNGSSNTVNFNIASLMSGPAAITVSDWTKMFICSRNGDSNVVLYRDGTQISTYSQVASNTNNAPLHIFGRSNAGTNDSSGKTPCSFAFVGGGLSAAEVATFTTIINTFQTSLSRNV